MKKGIKIAAGVIVGLGIIGSLAGGGDDTAPTTATTTANVTIAQVANVPATKPAATKAPETKAPTTKAPETKAPTTKAPVPTITSGERNALKKAESYLKYSAFSKKGLIDQLKFEGFSTEESTYAVNNVDVDWMEQAVLKAESYLKYSSFSKKGLIDQLKFEGFTTEQATYGANKAY